MSNSKQSVESLIKHVEDHLVKQVVQATSSIGCAYRGLNGTTCAVGCLIPDEMYDPIFENKGMRDLTNAKVFCYDAEHEKARHKFESVLIHIMDQFNLTDRVETIRILMDMQYIHDNNQWVLESESVEYVKDRFAQLRRERDLI